MSLDLLIFSLHFIFSFDISLSSYNSLVFKTPMLKTFLFQHLQKEIPILTHGSSFSVKTQMWKATYPYIWLWNKSCHCDAGPGVTGEVLEELFVFQLLLSCLSPNIILIKSNTTPSVSTCFILVCPQTFWIWIKIWTHSPRLDPKSFWN